MLTSGDFTKQHLIAIVHEVSIAILIMLKMS